MDYGYGDQYTTSYGAQGGMEGGGFMGGEGGSQSEGKSSRYMKDSIRPVTIKQIHGATQSHDDADFKIDGTEITQVAFVGQVRNISHLSTYITFKLDDGTGELEAKYWLEKDAMDTGDETQSLGITVGAYAKVWGKLGTFNNRRNLTAHVIRPLTDMNELHWHFLLATAVHLSFTRGPPNKDQAGVKSEAGGVAGGAAAAGTVNGRQLPPLSPLARKFYQTLADTPQFDDGLHVQHLAATMGVPVSEVYKASEELLGYSLIYTTMDDDTWAILEYQGK